MAERLQRIFRADPMGYVHGEIGKDGGPAKRVPPGQMSLNEADPSADYAVDPAEKRVLIAIHQREFVRGCLHSWLQGVCPGFEIKAVGSSDELKRRDMNRAGIVIVDTTAPMLHLDWLQVQIAGVRTQHPDLPVVVIVDAPPSRHSLAAVARLEIQGCIPTSSTAGIAAAALLLVLAGGTYFPRGWEDRGPTRQILPTSPVAPDLHCLTRRERAVLNLLERGMPNKTIAHQLSMSLSTTKVHVHKIIWKLKVQNRTEAAVFAGRGPLRGAEVSIATPIVNAPEIAGPSLARLAPSPIQVGLTRTARLGQAIKAK